jgi:serine phosphatase RsbU (regulator of sigma subunit)
MAVRKKNSHRTSTLQLTRHIESLQDGFRKLPKGAGLQDLARQFSGTVKNVFPGSEIDFAVRPADSEGWEALIGRSDAEIADRLELPEGQSSSRGALRKKSRSISFVQRLADKSHIGIVLERKSRGSAYSPADLLTLQLFVHLFDNAYQDLLYRRNEKDLIFSLNHRVLQLNSLIDTGIEVSKLDQSASPHELALERAASLTNASSGRLEVTSKEGLSEEIRFPAGAPMRKLPGKERRIATRFTFGGRKYTFELFEKESRKGIVPFEETDQLLLDALARQVHASLENRYLHEQALEKQKFEQDMAVAASIQQRILPAALPAIKGYDIAGINIPSKSVGGDYYDCIPLSDGRYALIIADVAGKGIPAALLVSSLHAYLSVYLENRIPLSELAGKLNKVIWRASTDDKFITAFIAVLSPDTGELELLNAGHNPAYLLRNSSSVQEFSAAGLPLGMVDMDFPYQSERVTIERGERLLLYTDGITEASDEHEEFYDDHSPLRDFVLHHRPGRADAFIADLIRDIKEFTGSAPQSDDITALYLHRTS